jgi:hypothetical protein
VFAVLDHSLDGRVHDMNISLHDCVFIKVHVYMKLVGSSHCKDFINLEVTMYLLNCLKQSGRFTQSAAVSHMKLLCRVFILGTFETTIILKAFLTGRFLQ